jgi:hypothetical protein
MDVMIALTGLSHAIGLTKQLYDIGKSIDEATFKLRVAEIQNSLADSKLALSDLRDQIHEKDRVIRELRESFAFREQMIEHQGYRYEAQAGKPVGLPFCPICASSGNIVRLTRPGNNSYESKCPKCKAEFGRVARFNFPEEGRG